MGNDAATFLFNEPCGFAQVFFGGSFIGDVGKDRGACVDGDDVGALGGESAGMCSTLAPGRAGNQYNLVLKPAPATAEISTHGSLFPSLPRTVNSGVPFLLPLAFDHGS
jgi:hypothetical protein